MLYSKNVPGWERGLRLLAGVMLVAAGWWQLPSGGVLGPGLIVSGLIAALTGSVGFCPMCALAGRRLSS
jgi:hypothetical protein